jgi:hypothetical protein
MNELSLYLAKSFNHLAGTDEIIEWDNRWFDMKVEWLGRGKIMRNWISYHRSMQ